MDPAIPGVSARPSPSSASLFFPMGLREATVLGSRMSPVLVEHLSTGMLQTPVSTDHPQASPSCKGKDQQVLQWPTGSAMANAPWNGQWPLEWPTTPGMANTFCDDQHLLQQPRPSAMANSFCCGQHHLHWPMPFALANAGMPPGAVHGRHGPGQPRASCFPLSTAHITGHLQASRSRFLALLAWPRLVAARRPHLLCRGG